MKTVKLITCSDAAQAHIIQGALENEGISSLLHNENMSTLLRGYINDIAGVDVLVDEAFPATVVPNPHYPEFYTHSHTKPKLRCHF
ncbi:putative signal transducing protein, partial [Bacteroides cellulosilyticus]|uniref:putative signal transducing protein n=1 Tax=Bacteroides cellulosilyticus TaxID=246787 RepID=UPI00397D1B7A